MNSWIRSQRNSTIRRSRAQIKLHFARRQRVCSIADYTNTHRKLICFKHTALQAVMVRTLRVCTHKGIRWIELPPIPCLRTYTSNDVTAGLSIRLHAHVIERCVCQPLTELFYVWYRALPVDVHEISRIKSSFHATKWGVFWRAMTCIHITYRTSYYWKKETFNPIGHFCSGISRNVLFILVSQLPCSSQIMRTSQARVFSISHNSHAWVIGLHRQVLW